MPLLFSLMLGGAVLAKACPDRRRVERMRIRYFKVNAARNAALWRSLAEIAPNINGIGVRLVAAGSGAQAQPVRNLLSVGLESTARNRLEWNLSQSGHDAHIQMGIYSSWNWRFKQGRRGRISRSQWGGFSSAAQQ